MSGQINCRPIDATSALCRIGDQEVICRNRQNEGVQSCSKVPGSEWRQCQPVDFYCALPEQITTSTTLKKGLAVKEISPDVIEHRTKIISGVRFEYFFSYGMTGFKELAYIYEKCHGKKINPMLMAQIKRESRAGSVYNYSRGYFGKSRWGGQKVAGSTATLIQNPGDKVRGIIMLVPEDIMSCIEKQQQSKPKDKAGKVTAYKYREVVIPVKVVIGPTETDLGETIMCKTFVGNIQEYSIPINETAPSENYLATIVGLLVDRHSLLTDARGKNKYVIEERRVGFSPNGILVQEQNVYRAHEFIQNRDGTFSLGDLNFDISY